MPAVKRHLTSALTLRQGGFTLVELMVTVTVMAVLSAIALPSFSTFMAENRAKAKATELTAAIQAAQFEASRRNRQVVFTLTSSIKPTSSLTGDVDGKSWASAALPLTGGDSDKPEIIYVGGYSEGASDVKLSATSTSLCFLPNGSLKANTSTGITGASCSVDASTGANIRVYPSKGDKVWRVSISVTGKVSSCLGVDDSKSLFSCS